MFTLLIGRLLEEAAEAFQSHIITVKVEGLKYIYFFKKGKMYIYLYAVIPFIVMANKSATLISEPLKYNLTMMRIIRIFRL